MSEMRANRSFGDKVKDYAAWAVRFRGTLGQVLLWMICGSLALELRWMRSDAEEYRETVIANERKLQAEIGLIQSLLDGSTVTEETKPTTLIVTVSQKLSQKGKQLASHKCVLACGNLS
jgi:hypothetical protein